MELRLKPRQRMWLHRNMQQWHWVSAALCFAALLLFSATGVTLNHAGAIAATPKVSTQRDRLPLDLRAMLAAHDAASSAALPARVGGWLEGRFGVDTDGREVEWSTDEVYVAAPGPGRDAWLAIDRSTGEIEFESTFRGWLAYFNDLHKGRNTGVVWQIFIDVFAAACLVFSFSGLVLLVLQARQRRSTWPAVGAGFGVLIVLMLLFVH
jgi:uncharacterized protein